MASTEHAEHATLALAQKICLHFRLITSVLQTEVPFHKDAFLQVKILTEDEKLLHERSIGDGDTKIGKGVPNCPVTGKQSSFVSRLFGVS